MTLIIPPAATARWRRSIEAVFDEAGPAAAITAAAEWLALAGARIEAQRRQLAALRRVRLERLRRELAALPPAERGFLQGAVGSPGEKGGAGC